MIGRAQVGPAELEQYRIDVPANLGRGRHPHDSNAKLHFTEVLKESTAGQHMLVHSANWRNRDRSVAGRSSQWGTQFDTPYHFADGGAHNIDKSLVSGPAVVLDLREALANSGNTLKITSAVIRAALRRVFALDKLDGVNPAIWQRVLLRTLTDKLANSEIPLRKFPYFHSPEAVDTLVAGIRNGSGGQALKVIMCEPPSVDEADQGHLAEASGDGEGGAHGALHRNSVLIGENFDFRPLNNGDYGVTLVNFDPVMAGSPDSDLISGAYFFPNQKLNQVRNLLVPDLSNY